MNPKTPITPQIKEEIKYAVSGASDSVVAEVTHRRGKQASYNIEAIATVLKSGKKFVLPSTIQRVNTVYEILQKLKEKGIKNAAYAAVKGTVQKHDVVSKNKKEYSYTTAQYFLFTVQ